MDQVDIIPSVSVNTYMYVYIHSIKHHKLYWAELCKVVLFVCLTASFKSGSFFE